MSFAMFVSCKTTNKHLYYSRYGGDHWAVIKRQIIRYIDNYGSSHTSGAKPLIMELIQRK